MEGLEISVLSLSELNDEYRYESEFFLKRYLSEEHALARRNTRPLGTFATVTDGPHGYHVVDETSPIAMLTAKCAKDWFSDRSSADTIASWVDTENKRSSLDENDIILSTRGTVGLAALVVKESLPANIDQDVARISWSDKQTYLPEFVIAYLNSRFGQDHITRYSSGMVQQGLSLQKVREIPIPALPAIVCQSVAETVRSALQCRRNADALLEQSEQLLLRSLDLENWQPPNPLTYSQSSTNAFIAGRLDAEHFKPKFAALSSHIENTGSFTKLGSLLAINDRGNQPEYVESGLPVVNSKHITNSEVRLDADNRVGLASAAKLLIEPGDVLMNGTGVGTIGRSAPYLHAGKAIPDNHVTILRPKTATVDPVYLSVFLNSLAGQLQVEQRLHGSSGQIELYPTDIANFTVWLAPEAIQQEIRQAVESGFAAKQRATELLEAAKRAVEIAIEDSEAAALAYLAEFS